MTDVGRAISDKRAYQLTQMAAKLDVGQAAREVR